MTRTQQAYGNSINHRSWSVSGAFALSALVAVALPSFAGCTTDINGALVVVQNQIPEAKDGLCLVPSKRETVRRISGTYDVDLDKDYPYFMFPLVRNDLPPIGGEGQIEPNRMEYMGVEVKIEAPAGVSFPGSASCPTEFAFSERVSMDPDSEIGSMVQVFLPCHAKLIRDMFNANTLPSDYASFVRFRVVVRAVGKHAGTTLKSDPFEYVVRVCKGCLQRGYEGGYAAFDYPMMAACSALEENPYQGNACNPAQDGLVLCCRRADGTTDCPGRPTPPPL